MEVVVWSVLGVLWIIAMLVWMGQGFGTSNLMQELTLQYGGRTGRKVFIALAVLTVIAIVGLRLL